MATMKLMQWCSERMFVFGVTLLASAVALILAVVWATTSTSAQESCPTRGDLQPQPNAPATVSGSWSASDCESSWSGWQYSDRYRLHVASRAAVTIELTGSVDPPAGAREGARATFLLLFSADQTELGFGGRGHVTSQIVRVLDPGTYLVEASTMWRDATGSYTLTVSIDESADSCSSSSGNIPVPVSCSESLSPQDRRDRFDDEDYADIYSFRLDAPQSDVFIDLESTDFHPFVRLLNDRGDQLEFDNGDKGGGARIVRTLSAGEYQIVATEYTDGRRTGAYELRVTASVRSGRPLAGPCTVVPAEKSWDGGLGGNPKRPDHMDVHNVKKLIVRVLFQIPRNRQDVVDCTYADYNDFGEEGPYRGGHAGWDVQTWNVAAGATANVPFYSLTAGTVSYINDALGAIGVDDGKNTVYYLHARYRYVDMDQQVAVGEPLGIQGDEGSPGKEHVHIEVHRSPGPHSFSGAANAPGRGGTGTLLLWPAQLNYLCAESAVSWLRLDNNEGCTWLTEENAPSLDLRPR